MYDAESLRFLGDLPYFRGIASAELAEILATCQVRALEMGETILLEGEPVDGLYAVRSGSVRVFKSSPEGKEQVLIVLGPGDTFNDVPAFDGGPNPASVQAAAPGTCVIVVPIAEIGRLLTTDVRVAANAARVLAARLRHLTMLVEDLSLRHIIQRVARLILEESARAGAVALTQQEMAARVGTAREVVSRALRDLERHGAIARRHNQIVLVDARVLEQLVQQGG